MTIDKIHVIDSHTGGEPTRVVISGGPDLGTGPLTDRRARFREQFDEFRSAVVNEPRGSDVVVGAILCPPVDPESITGVLFFNNVGYLHMCVHGTMGLVVTLAHLGRIPPGKHRIDTVVGTVTATLHEDGRVTISNVPSYRTAQGVAVNVEGVGTITGDVAWGGNWFFLVNDHGEAIRPDNVERLTKVAWRIRQALEREGITGDDGGEIDHIELFSPTDIPGADSRNFVLCPGKAFDRSPCGTGTSAKLACLAADGKLAEGQIWRQASIVGSIFEGSITQLDNGRVIPHVTGSAYVNAEATLLVNSADPFRMGIRP
jgi:4-hydroxyproline epimerase